MPGNFETPGISAPLEIDLSPMMKSFTAGIEQVRAFKQNTEKEFQQIKTAAEPLKDIGFKNIGFAQGSGGFGRIDAQRQVAADALANVTKPALTSMAVMNEMKGAGAVAAENYNEGFLKEMNNIAGRKSDFGKIAKLMAGGGVIGGLNIGAHVLDDLTMQAEKLAIAMDHGGDATRDAMAEMLKGLPIVGKLGEAGNRVWNFVTGETRYIARIKEATAAQDEQIKVMRELDEATRKFHVDADAWLGSLKHEIASVNFTDLQKAFDSIGGGFAKNIAGGAGLGDERLKAAQAAEKTALETLKKIEDQFRSTPRESQVPGIGLLLGVDMESELKLSRSAWEKARAAVQKIKDDIAGTQREGWFDSTVLAFKQGGATIGNAVKDWWGELDKSWAEEAEEFNRQAADSNRALEKTIEGMSEALNSAAQELENDAIRKQIAEMKIPKSAITHFADMAPRFAPFMKPGGADQMRLIDAWKQEQLGRDVDQANLDRVRAGAMQRAFGGATVEGAASGRGEVADLKAAVQNAFPGMSVGGVGGGRNETVDLLKDLKGLLSRLLDASKDSLKVKVM